MSKPIILGVFDPILTKLLKKLGGAIVENSKMSLGDRRKFHKQKAGPHLEGRGYQISSFRRPSNVWA